MFNVDYRKLCAALVLWTIALSCSALDFYPSSQFLGTNFLIQTNAPNAANAIGAVGFSGLASSNFLQGVSASNYLQSVQASNYLQSVQASNYLQGVSSSNYLQSVAASNYLQGVSASNYLQSVAASNYLQSVQASNYLQSVSASNYLQSVAASNYLQSVAASNYLQSVAASNYLQSVPTSATNWIPASIAASSTNDPSGAAKNATNNLANLAVTNTFTGSSNIFTGVLYGNGNGLTNISSQAVWGKRIYVMQGSNVLTSTIGTNFAGIPANTFQHVGDYIEFSASVFTGGSASLRSVCFQINNTNLFTAGRKLGSGGVNGVQFNTKLVACGPATGPMTNFVCTYGVKVTSAGPATMNNETQTSNPDQEGVKFWFDPTVTNNALIFDTARDGATIIDTFSAIFYSSTQ